MKKLLFALTVLTFSFSFITAAFTAEHPVYGDAGVLAGDGDSESEERALEITETYESDEAVNPDKAEEFPDTEKEGAPFDVYSDPDEKDDLFLFKVLATVLVPLIIAFVVCSGWKSKMETAVEARCADQYIPAGGFNLTVQQDQFLYRTETRTKIEKPPSSSGGGTTAGNRGPSGKSGKH